MNKTTIFLFSVLSLIVIALGLTFYDFNSAENQNITFRKKGVFVAPAVSHTSRSGAEMMFTSNPSKAKKIKIRNYYYTAELASSAQSANFNGYIRNDLSLLADNGAPKVAISANSNNGYRRYIADNSVSYGITGVASPQALRINTNRTNVSAVPGGVVQTGPMMGAVMNHDHIFDPLNPDKCGQDGCDAIPTFPNGWGDGIFEGDTEIEWVPVGDVAYPMLLLAAIYMIFIAIRKRSI
jgi:hypothetical protein